MNRIAAILVVLLCLSYSAAQERATTLPDGVRILASLETHLNVSRSEPGDEVEFEVAANLRAPGGAIAIPKGAKLIGKITEATPRSKDQNESRLAVVVHRAVWSGGEMFLNAVFDARQPENETVSIPGSKASVQPRPSTDTNITCSTGNSPEPSTEPPADPVSSQTFKLPSAFEDVVFRPDPALGMILVSTHHNISIKRDTRLYLVQKFAK